MPVSYEITCNCNVPIGSCSLEVRSINDCMSSFRCEPTLGNKCTGIDTGFCEISMENINDVGPISPTLLIVKASEIEYNGIVYKK